MELFMTSCIFTFMGIGIVAMIALNTWVILEFIREGSGIIEDVIDCFTLETDQDKIYERVYAKVKTEIIEEMKHQQESTIKNANNEIEA